MKGNDPQGLKSAIQTFHADPFRRYQMSKAAYRRFHQHATWAESMTQAAVFLEKMVATPRA